ncbi:orotidine 5'-phosphate decarboxylase [Thermobaculum terrenum ATCC BAA-798]|uniref:Orotidine 5'-phosphate decarboxylase n=1 Tax=Thermobaculum terrenum (strain ATCC BAA-798 / CCMEE 7001 / YNP1) TaxID=525904 RepID=D1CBN6_THET1|nr:orotidine-5'-phosphate decarboxylase [Thermobaculum terrenum]ACZ42201.1 orotidine 5'-phosphate decarboxylase [Thermobaculum terrenum ATCC BAA-798]
MRFMDKLKRIQEAHNTLLCVGLDPELDFLPEGFERSHRGVLDFNRAVIDATSDLVCAYKLNFAFYEAMGADGFNLLQSTLELIPTGVVTIADAKRGDIPNTSRMYAKAIFEVLGFDSVTVNPYMGLDSMMPFFGYHEKGVWVLCRTSNSGGADIQLLEVDDTPLYQLVASMVTRDNYAADVGLVVGATAPDELEQVRRIAPKHPLLIPGIGAQGGDLVAAVGASRSGPVVINVSRSIIHGPVDGIRARAEKLWSEINALRAGYP